MITEKDVVSLLPEESWITQYVTYCSSQTSSPLGYHLAVGLSLLAVSVPQNYTMRFFGKMPTNFFTLLAGRSGSDQKSTALNLGEEILDMAKFELIGDQPGSAEGLIDSLAQQPIQSIWYSEFGQFLSQSRSGYMESIKTTYTNLWDGKNISRRKAGDVIIRAEQPRLTMIAACSLPYLEQYTTAHDWNGGFMGRWFLAYCQRERFMVFPPQETPQTVNGRKYLAGMLQKFMDHEYKVLCLGMDTQAQEMYQDWYLELQNREMPELIGGTTTRASAIAFRVAMIYAWDTGLSRMGENWLIDLPTLQFAIAVAELHLKSVISLADRLVDHPDALLRRKILKQFNKPEEMKSLANILTATKMRKRTVTEVLDGLLIEGIIEEIPIQNTKNRVFQRKK